MPRLSKLRLGAITGLSSFVLLGPRKAARTNLVRDLIKEDLWVQEQQLATLQDRLERNSSLMHTKVQTRYGILESLVQGISHTLVGTVQALGFQGCLTLTLVVAGAYIYNHIYGTLSHRCSRLNPWDWFQGTGYYASSKDTMVHTLDKLTAQVAKLRQDQQALVQALDTASTTQQQTLDSYRRHLYTSQEHLCKQVQESHNQALAAQTEVLGQALETQTQQLVQIKVAIGDRIDTHIAQEFQCTRASLQQLMHKVDNLQQSRDALATSLQELYLHQGLDAPVWSTPETSVVAPGEHALVVRDMPRESVATRLQGMAVVSDTPSLPYTSPVLYTLRYLKDEAAIQQLACRITGQLALMGGIPTSLAPSRLETLQQLFPYPIPSLAASFHGERSSTFLPYFLRQQSLPNLRESLPMTTHMDRVHAQSTTANAHRDGFAQASILPRRWHLGTSWTSQTLNSMYDYTIDKYHRFGKPPS